MFYQLWYILNGKSYRSQAFHVMLEKGKSIKTMQEINKENRDKGNPLRYFVRKGDDI